MRKAIPPHARLEATLYFLGQSVISMLLPKDNTFVMLL